MSFWSEIAEIAEIGLGRRNRSKGKTMSEKTEWELIDQPGPGQRATLRDLLAASLGKWWRWKIAATVIVISAVLLFTLAVSGLVMLATLAIGVLSLAIGKVRAWLGGAFGQRHNPRRDLRSYSGDSHGG